MLEYLIPTVLATLAVKFILSLKSHRDFFSREHLFRGYEEGVLFIRELYKPFLFLMIFVHITIFWWVYTNYQPLANVASAYLFFLIPLTAIFYLETIMPKKTKYTDLVGLGDERDHPAQLVVGFAIGFVIVLSFITHPAVKMEFLAMPAIAVYFTIVAVPFTEEAVFGNLITTSTLKNFGIVPSLIISGVIFAVFHYAVYQANPFYMYMAFLFRVLAGVALIKFGSILPAFVGHVLINIVAATLTTH